MTRFMPKMDRKNVLIEIAVDCPVNQGIIPYSKRGVEIIPIVQYKKLLEQPYYFTEQEFHKEIFHKKMGKPDLNIAKYCLRRARLCKEFGWGIHFNEEGKIALVGCETEKYRQLQNDPSIKKIKAYSKYRNS